MILSTRDYLDARLGVHSYSKASADGVSLGVTPATVLRNDPSRLGFSFVNLSANVMWITPIGVPSESKGYYLGPNGGALSMVSLEDGEVVAWEWQGVASAPGSAYFTLEVLILPSPTGS